MTSVGIFTSLDCGLKKLDPAAKRFIIRLGSKNNNPTNSYQLHSEDKSQPAIEFSPKPLAEINKETPRKPIADFAGYLSFGHSSDRSRLEAFNKTIKDLFNGKIFIQTLLNRKEPNPIPPIHVMVELDSSAPENHSLTEQFENELRKDPDRVEFILSRTHELPEIEDTCRLIDAMTRLTKERQEKASQGDIYSLEA